MKSTSSIAVAVFTIASIAAAAEPSVPQADARWLAVWNDSAKDALIRQTFSGVNQERMSADLFHLSKDPLPFRKLNLTLPGHEKCTLYEADDFLAKQLESAGYQVDREGVTVQAYRRDTRKPISAQYSAPMLEDPTYTAYNLYAEKRGEKHPDEIIVLVAHKDSQSWIDSPGANDNAIGTIGILEIGRALSAYKSQRAIRFLFCNEEHTPWTSVTAATKAKERGDKIIAVFNTDGIGVKSVQERAAGKKTNVTAYSQPEGLKLAELMSGVNSHFQIGLEQRSVQRTFPNDDDGSFVKAGFPAAVINIGSWPYGDPNYHTPGDIPELCDVENAAMTARAIIAAVMTIDQAE
jgi:hypothetical protein